LGKGPFPGGIENEPLSWGLWAPQTFAIMNLNIPPEILPPNVLVTMAIKLGIFSYNDLLCHHWYVIVRKYSAHVLNYPIVNE
jgi:hypothetical protein